MNHQISSKCSLDSMHFLIQIESRPLNILQFVGYNVPCSACNIRRPFDIELPDFDTIVKFRNVGSATESNWQPSKLDWNHSSNLNPLEHSPISIDMPVKSLCFICKTRITSRIFDKKCFILKSPEIAITLDPNCEQES